MPTPPNPKLYIDSRGLAARHQLSEETVRANRSRKLGPPYVKFGGRVFYEIKTVERWESDQLNHTINKAHGRGKKG